MYLLTFKFQVGLDSIDEVVESRTTKKLPQSSTHIPFSHCESSFAIFFKTSPEAALKSHH